MARVAIYRFSFHIYRFSFILKCSVESCDTVLSTWEVDLYKVIAENGKLNYDFIPTSLFRGCPLIRGFSFIFIQAGAKPAYFCWGVSEVFPCRGGFCPRKIHP